MGIKIIMDIRSKKKNNKAFPARKKIRPFKIPVINFEAKTVSQLSDLTKAESEPLFTRKLTSEELLLLQDTPFTVDLPCTTTAVERAVQITTAAASVSSNPEERDGFTMAKIAARKRRKL